MRGWRSCLALAYLLASTLAIGVHDHASESERPAKHEAGCADPRPHISGHWSPDLTDVQDHCLACQFRADHHYWLIGSPSFRLTRVETLAEQVDLPVSLLRLQRPTGRAPPHHSNV